ncbi:branched-chain amino acid ABC transporter permease [Chloroflexota bacterium]
MDASLALQIILNGLMLSSIYILVALGLTLVFGVMHILNFAHGELYMLGSFAVFYLYGGAGMNYFLALIIAMVAVGLAAIVLERIFFRPVRDKLMPSVMVAIGLSITIQELSRIGFGAGDRFMPSVFHGSVQLLGTTLTMERLAVIVAGAILLVGLYLFVTRTKAGKAMRAVEQDSVAAALQGISLNKTSALCMFIGGALAAVAGGLLGPVFYVHPYMGTPMILKAFIIIILGGIGSMPGAVLGGLALGFTESISTVYLGAKASLLIGFAILIAILLFRPRGLLGYE